MPADDTKQIRILERHQKALFPQKFEEAIVNHTWKPAAFSKVAILCTKPKAENTYDKFKIGFKNALNKTCGKNKIENHHTYNVINVMGQEIEYQQIR